MQGPGSANIETFTPSLPQAWLLPSVNPLRARLITDHKVEKLLAPLSPKGGGVITNDWCIIHRCGGQRNTERCTIEHVSEIVRDESPGMLSKVKGGSSGGQGVRTPPPHRFFKIWVFAICNVFDYPWSEAGPEGNKQNYVSFRIEPLELQTAYERKIS